MSDRVTTGWDSPGMDDFRRDELRRAGHTERDRITANRNDAIMRLEARLAAAEAAKPITADAAQVVEAWQYVQELSDERDAARADAERMAEALRRIASFAAFPMLGPSDEAVIARATLAAHEEER